MGNTPINIYIDLSKAFDTLDHTILISKLQHYGITGAAPQLLVSYLSNRKQFVQYGDVLSQKTVILMGVPVADSGGGQGARAPPPSGKVKKCKRAPLTENDVLR